VREQALVEQQQIRVRLLLALLVEERLDRVTLRGWAFNGRKREKSRLSFPLPHERMLTLRKQR